jgi:hypothetical protein
VAAIDQGPTSGGQRTLIMSESIDPVRLRWSTAVGGDPTVGDMAQASITAEFPARGRPTTFQLQWTGTPTGTWSFRGSNKHDPNRASDTKWTTIDSSLFSPALVHPAGSASDHAVIIPDHGFEWLQAVYTRTGSTGSAIGDAKARVA